MVKLCVVVALLLCTFSAAEDETGEHENKVHHHGPGDAGDESAALPFDIELGDEGEEVPPKIAADVMKTIFPAMPKTRLISAKYWPLVKQVTGMQVEYKYYWDYNTKKTTYTTKKQLETLAAIGKPTWGSVLKNAAGDLMLILLFAYLYKICVVDKRKPFPTDIKEMATTKDFKFGLIDWCSNMNICCLACCCAPMRAADTFASIGSMPYWNVIGIWLGIACLTAILPVLSPFFQENSTSLCYLLIASVFFRCRNDLRKKLGNIQDADAPTQALDCLTWCCCQCCVIAQEARVHDAASGEEPMCPFCSGLKPTKLETEGSTEPLVGNPVQTNT